MELGHRAIGIDNRREGGQPQVDPARRSIRPDGPALVEFAPVDLDLERDPPAPRPLLHRCTQHPRRTDHQPTHQPGHVLPSSHLPDPGQSHRAGVDRRGTVGVVAEPSAVLALTPRREPDLAALALAGTRIDEGAKPGRPGATRLLGHPRGQPGPSEPRKLSGVRRPPRRLQRGRRPRHQGQLAVGYPVGLLRRTLIKGGLHPFQREVLHQPRQPSMLPKPDPLLISRGQLHPESLSTHHRTPPRQHTRARSPRGR